MDFNNFSNEFQNSIGYGIDSLFKEFPFKEFTLEHLILCILDNPKSNVVRILDNFLTTANLARLREVYGEYLASNSIKSPQETNEVKFSGEVSFILKNADDEKSYINTVTESQEKLGSEHVLLAMINGNEGIERIRNVFENMSVDYATFRERCIKLYTDKQNKKKSKEINIVDDPITMAIRNVTNAAKDKKGNNIKQFTENITEMARNGQLDTVVGRDNEVDVLIKILSRRKKNNAVIVGDGGVGKTSVVHKLAQKIVNGDVPDVLRGKEILLVNVMALVGGTHFRGMMEERISGLFSELKKNKNNILFFDDMQQILKTSTKEKDSDLSSMINEILEAGDVSIIGTMGYKDYRNGVEINPSLSRKLQKVIINPPSLEDAKTIVMYAKEAYEKFHNVHFSEEVVNTIVSLSNRYVSDRKLPDSAIDVIDLCGAYNTTKTGIPKDIKDTMTQLAQVKTDIKKFVSEGDFSAADAAKAQELIYKKKLCNYDRLRETNGNAIPYEVTESDVMKVISDITQVPISRLSVDDKKKLANIEDTIKQNLIGQDEAVDAICKVIKRNKVGLSGRGRPMGIALLLGKSGTGKTMLAKQIAKHIFGSESDLVRIDMSEYSEKSSISKLIGSAPGYIGYENGGQLTESIKNKQHCVLLLDEIEKANEEVYNLFLQLFDEGRLTDSSGQIVNFKNTIVLMTSNVGAKKASELGNGLGFIADENSNKNAITDKELRKKFTPEFLNRIDKIVHFNPLTDENLKSIVVLELSKLSKRLNEIGYNLAYTDSVVNKLSEMAIAQKEYGARPIIHLIQDNVEDVITDAMLLDEYEKGYTFKIDYVDDNFQVVK